MTTLMALLGFFAPFLPDVIGLGKGWSDHKQEMSRMRLRAELAQNAHGWRVEEMEIQGEMADLQAVRKPHVSYGVQMLDKASLSRSMVSRWVFNLVFIGFTALDGLISSVRPVITYWAFGLYCAVKMATLTVIFQATERFTDGTLEAWARALTNEAVFTAFDQNILTLVLTFWFGQRLKSGRASRHAKS